MSEKKKNGRGANGVGSIRKKTVIRNGKEYTYWEARCTVGFDPGTGKQIQRSVSGKTQKEVAQKMKAISVEVDQGIYQTPSKLTVGEWLDIWLKEYTADLKPLSLVSYRHHVDAHIKPYIGATKLAALNTPAIQAMYNKLAKGTKEKKGLSNKTLKDGVHACLHKALRQAVEIGYLHFNPADACKVGKVPKVKIQVLEDKMIPAFFDAIKGDPYELIYRIDLFTGMRQGEILGLSWNCVNFQEGTILVEQQLQCAYEKGKGYRLTSLKNGKSRKIAPAPTVMQLLQNQKTEQAKMRLWAGDAWSNPDNLVFTDATGKHLYHENVYKHFKAAVKKIGLPNMRFHDLRHSFAVASLQNGDSAKTVQENLGHASASFTLDVYGGVSDSMRRESAQRMEAFIQSVSG